MIAFFPEILSCAASGDVERLGILVRTYFAGDQRANSKPNIPALLADVGITVTRLSLSDYGAIAATDANGRVQCIFAIKDKLETSCERFLLAHMLGHFLLVIQPKIVDGNWERSGLRESDLPDERYAASPFAPTPSAAKTAEDQESQADAFAAAFLMPKGMVLRAHKYFGGVASKTAEFFGVSVATLQRRILALEAQLPQITVQPARTPATTTAAAQRPPALDPARLTAPAAATRTPAAARAGAATERPKAPAANPNPAIDPELKGMERVRRLAKLLEKPAR